MDAEVWSHADIRNGRMLFALLATVMLAQEIAVLVLLLFGYPLTMPEVSSGAFAAVPEVFRAALGVLLSLLLAMLAFGGRGWARVSLGFVVVMGSLYMAACAVPSLWHSALAGLQPDGAVLVSFGLSALGLVSGGLFLWLPALRAFAWSRSTARDAIPVPLDDGPTQRRALRRHPTLGERVVSLMVAFGHTLIVLAILAGFAMVYGMDEWLRAWLVR